MRPPLIFWVFNSPSPAPQGPMDPTGGEGTSADIVPTQIIFGVDPCTRCWNIAQKSPNCKNFPLTPIITKISFASFSARRRPPTPKLPRSRPWCLLYLSQNFTPIAPSCVEISSTVQTNKQTNKQTKQVRQQDAYLAIRPAYPRGVSRIIMLTNPQKIARKRFMVFSSTIGSRE